MTKITYMPWQEIVVHEVLEFDNQRFFKEIVSQTALQRNTQQQQFIPISVTWADGVAFVCVPFPDTEDVIVEKLHGKIHYATILFTKMPYKETYPLEIGREAMAVELERGEDNPLFSELAKFLKNFKHDRPAREQDRGEPKKSREVGDKETPSAQ